MVPKQQLCPAQGVISANYNSLAMGGLQRFGMLLQILCTGFVLLLCLVCMANIHNSLSTGMELRAREYGILRSVGITPVDFRKMIWLESLFYESKRCAGVYLLEWACCPWNTMLSDEHSNFPSVCQWAALSWQLF